MHVLVKMYVMRLPFLLDSIFIRFGTKLYRQVVGIPMGTNCAPLSTDLFLFCYERGFMISLSDDTPADIIDAFNTTSRYLDDILNIYNVSYDNLAYKLTLTVKSLSFYCFVILFMLSYCIKENE